MNFSLPCQHSMVHYHTLIRAFGAPNGLCSSITESKHIAAVKKPWQRSNHYKAIGQMLLTNQRLDKLAAMRVDFTRRKMLDNTCLTEVLGEFTVAGLSTCSDGSQHALMCTLPFTTYSNGFRRSPMESVAFRQIPLDSMEYLYIIYYY
jgi:hypothetical protein